MTLLTIWPYLLVIPGLLLGIVLGWQWQLVRQRRKGAALSDSASPASRAHARLRGQHESPDDAQGELDYIERQLVSLNGAVAKARQQLKDLDSEHAQLQQAIDQRRADVDSSRASLDNLSQVHEAQQQEEMLMDIDDGGEEIELLQKMRETYSQRINRMVHEVEVQESTLAQLRQTRNQNVEEIARTEEEIRQAESELDRLVEQHEQRRAELSEAMRALLERQQHNGAQSARPGRPRLAEHVFTREGDRRSGTILNGGDVLDD